MGLHTLCEKKGKEIDAMIPIGAMTSSVLQKGFIIRGSVPNRTSLGNHAMLTIYEGAKMIGEEIFLSEETNAYGHIVCLGSNLEL